MGDLNSGLQIEGFQETSEAGRQELERVRAMLLRPDTRFRLETDSNYDPEQDKRMDPSSNEYLPFDKVLENDWREFVKDRIAKEKTEADLERDWLSPLSESDINAIFQAWIDKAKDPQYRADLENYKQTYLQAVRDYTQQHQQESSVQDRKPIAEPLTDLEYRKIPAISLFALEIGIDLINRVTRRPRRINNLDDYVQKTRLLYEQQGLPFSEDGRTKEDALRSLSKREVEDWFEKKFEEIVQDVVGRGLRGDNHAIEQAERRFKELGYSDLYYSLFPETAPASSLTEKTEFPEDIEPPDSVVERYQVFIPPQKSLKPPIISHDKYQPQEILPSFMRLVVPEHVASQFAVVRVDSREAPEGLEDRVQNYESYFNVRQGRLNFTYETKVNDHGTMVTKTERHYINLSTEAIASIGTDKELIDQVLVNLIKLNRGANQSVIAYNIHNERIILGLGDEKHPTEVLSLTPDELRKQVPEAVGFIKTYLTTLKVADRKLDFQTERIPMWDFEKLLRATWGENSNRQEVTLQQKVWDEAFRRAWETAIGPEKLAELRSGGGVKQPQKPLTGAVEVLPVQESRQREKNILQNHTAIFDDSRRTLTGVFNIELKGNSEKRFVVVNLPPLAYGNIAEQKESLQQALAQLMELNDYKKNPRMRIAEGGSLVLYYGDEQHHIDMQVLSQEVLRNMVDQIGLTQDALVSYINAKQLEAQHNPIYSSLSTEQRNELKDAQVAVKDFERKLLVFREVKNRTLGQSILDRVIEQIWSEHIGPEKLAELQQLLMKAPPDKKAVGKIQPIKRRKQVNDKVSAGSLDDVLTARTEWLTNNPEANRKAGVFSRLVKNNFKGNYVSFINSGKFIQYADQAGLELPEAIAVLGSDALETTRGGDYKLFMELSQQSSQDISDYLVMGKVPKSVTKSSLMLRVLNKMLTEGSHEPARNAREALTSVSSASERRRTPEEQAEYEHKILARIDQIIDATGTLGSYLNGEE